MNTPARLILSTVTVLFGAAGLTWVSIFPGCAYKSSDVLTDVDTPVHNVTISGRVVDQEQKGIGGATVSIWEKDGDLTMERKSGGDGSFSFEHKPCTELTLEVKADRGKKLAAALIEHLPGDKGRKLVVEMKSGYLVTGRVTHDGKGLKGLIVRVSTAGEVDTRTKVHGGGLDETGRGGAFNLILTSGKKKLLVINDKYPEYARHAARTFTVSDDAHLGKIELH